MTFTRALELYGIALVLFLAIDLLWLGIVANSVYRGMLGSLMRDKPNVPVAFAFYALFVVGLVYFGIAPADDGGSIGDALRDGALYGLFTYATFDLTNLAVLRDYPARIVPIDMAWGTVLGAAVSGGTWQLADWLL
ncbi:MAG: hypothetical protein JWM98_2655 [Thermoleophilia bacterium]|nr:hypothetical protein [Thermoleophilia bacterium]